MRVVPRHVVPGHIGAGWLVPALLACTLFGAAQAAEDRPPTTALEPTRQTEGVVRVIVDFARPLILARPASTLIIGNPTIAQATLSDDKTVILTGKTPGSTNLIVMDAAGAEVANIILDVAAAGGRLITVDGGSGRATYSCTERCDPVQSNDETTAPPPPASPAPPINEGGEP
ncbi:PilQ-like protein; component of type IV pilus (plasmid) [Sinorhizobium fredii NGR234]|uniref:CpaC n=1 Tax=Sinorhizobium fredii (strain NBRC 101917 / NGR234) TaxID=394 RepID=Q6W1S0_SINFN|nr:pilus assembly protein N-terminal domain-containing protein [Sinorhizobium fredii]AAQ87298.1 CpaC [Sinorhizobium fredii NGR234]ACP21835.1 PilQ-like protein; component of type IV pilus [Sinorhizobium fredii NGR234]